MRFFLRPTRLAATLLVVSLSLATGSSAGTITQLVFTKGGSYSASNTFKSTLLAFIASATSTIDVAIYNLRDDDVIAALNAAAAGGKTVRVVTDGENNVSGHPIKNLSGITVKDDGSNAAEMHHKFIVIDYGLASAAVWTGSANFTGPSFSSQNNNAIIIQDGDVASIYRAEFNRLFTSNLFHTNKASTASKVTMDDGTVVEIRFSPGSDDGSIQTAYANLVTNAASAFYYAIYTYNSSTIYNAMAAKLSLSNYGLFEGGQASNPSFTKYDDLNSAGATVALDANPFEMHHKYMVVDGSIVATGSYNFTSAGNDDNDENSVIIRNNAPLAKVYIQELNRIAGVNEEAYGTNDDRITSGDTSAPTSDGSEPTSTPTTTTAEASTNAKILHGPNPFRMGGGTTMKFTSSDAGYISRIEILDMTGRLVHAIVPSSSTTTSTTWDGKNIGGAYLGAGSYFYRVKSGGKYFTGRFVAIR